MTDESTKQRQESTSDPPDNFAPATQPRRKPFDRWEDGLCAIEDLPSGIARGLTLFFEPEACDLCGALFAERRFLIDGSLSDSDMGANMCAKCYGTQGTHIGWGTGQLYTQMEDRTWLMTAGFPPDDEE